MKIKNIESVVDNEFGGKAQGLQKLVKLGVAVPSGLAIDGAFINKLIIRDSEALSLLSEHLAQFGNNTFLAVRSSASNEDGSENSFAGMYESILNVSSKLDDVVSAIKRVYSSLETKKTLSYSNQSTEMNIVIQQMVDAKIAGVCFTSAIDLDGENIAFIEYVDGLADKLVSGKVVAKMIKLNLDNYKSKNELEIDASVVEDLFKSLKLIIENNVEGLDIEWCVDQNNKAYFLQARPITERILLRPKLSSGSVASPGSCFGKVYIIDDDMEDDEIEERIENFPEGSILVARVTDTNYVSAMKKAAGIITTEGSILSHAAIIAREFNIPCITGYKEAFDIFENYKDLSIDTNTLIMNYDNTEIAFGRGNGINVLELYDYENIIEENYNGNTILVELVGNEFGIHISDELDQNEIDEIDIYIRKKYKRAPIILQDQKYLWYFEFKRFIKIPGYIKLIEQSKELLDEMSIKSVDEFVNKILTIMKKTNESINNSYDEVFSAELAQALHYLINLHFCNGIAMKRFIEISKEKRMDLKDMINSKTDTKEIIFLKKIEEIREKIWAIFVENGWTNDDYFEIREENMQKKLNYSEDDVIDYFYETVPNEKKTLWTNHGKKIYY